MIAAAGDRGGYGRATQAAFGTPVFGGMLASAIGGILMLPGLHVTFQTLRETIKGLCGNKGKPETAAQ